MIAGNDRLAEKLSQPVSQSLEINLPALPVQFQLHQSSTARPLRRGGGLKPFPLLYSQVKDVAAASPGAQLTAPVKSSASCKRNE